MKKFIIPLTVIAVGAAVAIEMIGKRRDYGEINDREEYEEKMIMAKSKIVKVNEEIAEVVTDGYKKIENGVVGGYKKVEEGVVGGFTKISDKFVEEFLVKEGETVEEAKERIAKETDERKCRETGIK